MQRRGGEGGDRRTEQGPKAGSKSQEAEDRAPGGSKGQEAGDAAPGGRVQDLQFRKDLSTLNDLDACWFVAAWLLPALPLGLSSL